jgi:hypothetical protein
MFSELFSNTWFYISSFKFHNLLDYQSEKSLASNKLYVIGPPLVGWPY